MYELIILSRLMREPSHGYLMSKIINDMFGPFAKISNGRFYPLLAKLEQDGYIEVYNDSESEGTNNRQSRKYAITEKGRMRFHQQMMDISSNPGEYQKIFILKSTALDLLEPHEVSFLFEHYITYCQAHILHSKAEFEDFRENGEAYVATKIQANAILSAIQHIGRQWEVELEWAKSLQEIWLANPVI